MCCYFWPLIMIYYVCILLDVCGICLSLEKIHHRLHTKNIQKSYNVKQHNINNYLSVMSLVRHVNPSNIVLSWQISCNLHIGTVPELSSWSVRLYKIKYVYYQKEENNYSQHEQLCQFSDHISRQTSLHLGLTGLSWRIPMLCPQSWNKLFLKHCSKCWKAL